MIDHGPTLSLLTESLLKIVNVVFERQREIKQFSVKTDETIKIVQ